MTESMFKYFGVAVVFTVVCGFSALLWSAPKNGQKGEIVIGQSCALSGPNRLLGTDMRDGARLFFNDLNSKGGINGKKIKLITYDDGYEPARCVANTRKLIDEDKVFLLFGYVGTPTSKEALPIVIKEKIPFFAPYTGANLLRNPLKKEVFNIRASYHQETELMVDRLVNELGFKKISVFYQNDAYGEDGLNGVKKALGKRKMKIFSTARYERNTIDVQEGIRTFSSPTPDAVIMIGTYSACGTLVSIMREKKSQIVFLNVSFVGGDALGSMLNNKGIGVIVTQVTPYPYFVKIPIVGEYKSLLNRMMPDATPSHISLEGYIAAKTLCHILQDTPVLTRAAFIAEAEKLTALDLGGFTLSFSPASHQGSNIVNMTQIGPAGYLEHIESLTKIREY
jgi:ABC-type branched-subunit amino acid transport system substrate-binding protein